jgi:dienelactone hydrolase
MRYGVRVLFMVLAVGVGTFAGVHAQSPQGKWQGFAMERVQLAAKDGEKIPGIFLHPQQTGKHPVVLILHGYTMNKDAWLTEAFTGPDGETFNLPKALLKSGYAVFAIDERFHGERSAGLTQDQIATKIWGDYDTFFANMMSDIHVSLDYLERHPSVSNIGMLGYSLGGMLAFGAADREPRIQTAVFCVPPALRVLNQYKASGLKKGHLGSMPWLMIMAKKDQYSSVADAKALYNTMPSAKKNLIFIDSGHVLPPSYIADAVDWFKEYLKP